MKAAAKRERSRGAKDFLPEVLRFCPPDKRELVQAVFLLGRGLRNAEREDEEPVNDIGVFLDMVDNAAAAWRDVARVVNETPR